MICSVCLTVKPVGEPDAGNPHVRFDERGWETERCRMAQATAPILDYHLAHKLIERHVRSWRKLTLNDPTAIYYVLEEYFVRKPSALEPFYSRRYPTYVSFQVLAQRAGRKSCAARTYLEQPQGAQPSYTAAYHRT